MLDLTVIILVGREERHICRCLEKLAPLAPRQVFIVESQKGDRTHDVAVATNEELGMTSEEFVPVWHDWEGNQARQFNWALDNLPIEGAWVLRLDADEYLTDELIVEIKEKLPLLQSAREGTRSTEVDESTIPHSSLLIPHSVDGVIFKRRHYFAGGWAKHGTYPVRILRLFRTGRGRYAPNQLMDERIEVGEWRKEGNEWRLIQMGKTIEFENDFVDHSLIPMSEWRAKHRAYAAREAAQALEGLRTGRWTDPRKATYYRLPPYFRAVAYFFIRYVLKRGFLDGYAGWMWNFWQGLWYRWIVDREVSRLLKSHSTSAHLI